MYCEKSGDILTRSLYSFCPAKHRRARRRVRRSRRHIFVSLLYHYTYRLSYSGFFSSLLLGSPHFIIKLQGRSKFIVLTRTNTRLRDSVFYLDKGSCDVQSRGWPWGCYWRVLSFKADVYYLLMIYLDTVPEHPARKNPMCILNVRNTNEKQTAFMPVKATLHPAVSSTASPLGSIHCSL